MPGSAAVLPSYMLQHGEFMRQPPAMVVLTAGPSHRSQPEASVSSIGHEQEKATTYSCDFNKDIVWMLQLGLFNLLHLDLVRLDVVYSFHSGVVMLKTK